MAGGIDHIVIAVADPDAATAELTEKIGLAFTGGGRHPGLGTFNRLAFLGDAYLELIGVEDEAAAQGWAVGRAAVRALERGGGFATYALADDQITATVARLQANGSSIGPAIRGSRVGADGDPVEWTAATLRELGPDQPPFLIHHVATGSEWSPAAMTARRSFVHPIGAPARLLSLEIQVADPVAAAADCVAQLGMEFRSIASAAVATLGRHVVRLVPVDPSLPVATAAVRVGATIAPHRSATVAGMSIVLLGIPAV